MEIRTGGLDHPDVVALLQEHLRGMAELSPPDSIHALDLDGLRQPQITFWSAWQDEELVGCGALKQLDATHGEIKSMRTASRHRRKGVAAAMLEHILDEARRRDYTQLSLETGSMQGFEPARALYARYGFRSCGPFAQYTDDPNSVFMTRAVQRP
ncbi:GNAT family N-acetyltransferase [Lysobacter arvi]|uniref:GNAT family N-acetyltransferase n=1 Tax=Lysobacter arvi TaxID=3038776 RepID=A0ABU1CIV1_9GAMM|nr:GNAT family N-acetyltransferase [Lysobacter arvi]MDR0184853.1 GNAT family N-acetyltransferase [Lysobacter arvi]